MDAPANWCINLAGHNAEIGGVFAHALRIMSLRTVPVNQYSPPGVRPKQRQNFRQKADNGGGVGVDVDMPLGIGVGIREIGADLLGVHCSIKRAWRSRFLPAGRELQPLCCGGRTSGCLIGLPGFSGGCWRCRDTNAVLAPWVRLGLRQ